MNTIADRTLKALTRFWFGVLVIGQVLFAAAVASFYGLTALRGDYHRWRQTISHGHVPGDTIGNLAVAVHVGSAAIIMLAGVLQLIPAIRRRFPRFHRWTGRLYMVTAVTVSVAGLYMQWIRGSVGYVTQHIGSTLNAVLIWIFAGLALRTALARDFAMHRRWTLRLFLTVSATFFYRLGFFLVTAVAQRPVGFDPTTFTGPFPTFMSFATYLVPLAILELYFLASEQPGAGRRFAMAAAMLVITVGMLAGTLAVSMAQWVPNLKAAFDTRKSISETISETIVSKGVDYAVRQYHDLKSARTAAYNFEESELNSLGYDLLRAKKVQEAIRVLKLNAESFPHSSNVYDSLGEAYLDAGDRPDAIANYRISLQLNPRNEGAVVVLRRLGVK